MKTQLKTFVRCISMTLFTSPQVVEVKSRDLKGLSIPQGTIAFYFFDVLFAVVKHDGKDVEISSNDPINISKMHLIGSQTFTKEELLRLLSDDDRAGVAIREIRESPFEKFVSIGRPLSRPNGTIELSAIVPFDPESYELVTLEPKVG